MSDIMLSEPTSRRTAEDDAAISYSENEPDGGSSSDSDKVTTKGRRFLRPHTGRNGVAKQRRPVLTAVAGIYSSHSYYNYLWAEAMVDIRELLAEEKDRGVITGSDLRRMFQTIIDVYYKYLKIYKTIDLVYDQMVHPQKRIIVKKVLDVLISRLLELRWELLLCDKSEISYFDEFAMIEGVFPKEIDMPIPKYYYHDPTPAQIIRDKWFWNVVERERVQKAKEEELARRLAAQLALIGEDQEEQRFEDDEDRDDEDIATPLQMMERARQGKCRAMIAKYIFKEEQIQRRERKRKQKLKLLLQRGKKLKKTRLGMDADTAASHIQKLVRGFLARVRVKRVRNSEMEFLGIRSQQLTKHSPFAASRQKCKAEREELAAKEERRRTQRKLQQREFEDAQVHLYNRLLQIEGPEMAEQYKLQIRTWMLEVRERTGKFPDIPKPEAGGSLLMLCQETLSEDMQEMKEGEGEVLDPEAEAKTKKDKKAKDKEKKEKAKAKAKAKKGGPNIIEDPSLTPLKFFDELKEANFDYNRFWRGGDRENKKNPKQNYEEKHIIREKRELVETEIREQVDTAIKSEIEYLKQVIEKKKSKKGKKGKGKGKGKKGKGKGKKGKKKKGKDLTPDRTMESLFEELVQNNIIRHFPKVRMDELISQSSFINGELRTYHAEHPFENKSEERYMPGDVNPHPSFGDIIRAVKDVCILPMGSIDIHRVAPFLTKSVLIVGPPGSGKKTLVNMVCTELNATLVDLTAANIVGKYPGKPGLKMLMHLIQKVGKAVEPVIFLIDNCERTYMKKVPKTNHDEPKRLKKQLGKFLKTFTPEDLFLLIGLSSEPWVAPFKTLKKDYQRIFYVPPADYGTRLLLWKEGLATISELLHPDINYTLLAKLSQGWTSGSINKTCRDVVEDHHKDLSERNKETSKETDPWRHLGRAAPVRFIKIGKVYITMSKLMQYISEYDPVFIEQEKLWNSWWNKTPLQKARLGTQVKVGPEKKKGKKGKKKSK